MNAVLTGKARALDSLYALTFGTSRELPIPEHQLLQSINRAIESNVLLGGSPDTSRVMQDLGLTAAEIRANAKIVVELYRYISAYDVYTDLIRFPAQSRSLEKGSLTLPPFNAAESRLLAMHPWLLGCTLASIVSAKSSARLYFIGRGGLHYEDYFYIDEARANAYEHALWNVLLVESCGSLHFGIESAMQWAEDFTDAHEFGHTGIASSMDFHNNAVGRAIVRPLAFLVDEGLFKTVATPPAAELRTLVAAKADMAVFVRTAQELLTHSSNLVYLRPPLLVKLTGTGTGVVTSPERSVECMLGSAGLTSGHCAYDVRRGPPFELSATAGTGSFFTGWSGDCSGSVCLISDDRARTVTATFNAISNYSLTVTSSPSNGGAVTGSGSYLSGTTAELNAFPADGFVFSHWREGTFQVSMNNPFRFTVTSNRSLTAIFTQVQQPTTYSINLSASPIAGGNVSGGGAYTANARVLAVAVATSGYSFVRWTEAGIPVSTDPHYSFNASSSRSLVAEFVLNAVTYSIGVSASPFNGGNVGGGGSHIPANSTVTLFVTPASGFTFSRWTENGQQVSTSPSYSFIATANRSLVANFSAATPTTYFINLSASPSNGGSLSGGGAYNVNAAVNVSAFPASGYSFVRWSQGGSHVSSSANYSFLATANRSLVAEFSQNAVTYSIGVSASPFNGGNVGGGGSHIPANSIVTLLATPTSGFTFSRWTENGQHVSTSSSYTFAATGNRHLIANFNSVATLQAPTPISPGNGSSPGTTITTVTPTFLWSSVSGATNYGVAVRDLTTNQLVYDNDFVGNVLAIVLPAGTLVRGRSYKWDVRASANGVFSPYSADFYFRIQ